VPSTEGESPSLPQPDQAWKALSITNEWIRHADTKTGVTLAFVGATATVLFNLIKNEQSWTYWLVFAVVLCAAALVAAATFACAALFPRTRRQARQGTPTDEEAVNLLFFGDIVGHYTKDLPSYTQVLSLLTGNPARLTEQIAAQIHENAHIATAKFKHVNRAILAEVAAVGAAALVGLPVHGRMVNVDGNYSKYDYISSAKRLDEILDQPSGQFEEANNLPDRDRLTFTNGFYGWCSAIFVDIRDSSGLTDKHTRPTLAKIYRAFISEMVAVLNGADQVREVNIVGDCVWAVYNTPTKPDINQVFSRASHANTLKKLLNAKLEKNGLSPLNFGIGIDYGRALMIKAGYSGSGINEVVYMGDVVNSAAHLAHRAGRGSNKPIYSGTVFAQNLNEHNSGLLTSSYDLELSRTVHVGNVVNIAMNDWISEAFK